VQDGQRANRFLSPGESFLANETLVTLLHFGRDWHMMHLRYIPDFSKDVGDSGFTLYVGT
jgi:hypothetical protein